MMSVFAVPIWLPLLLLLPILLLMKDKIHGRRQNKNLPPSPPYLPIIGNMHLIGNLPHQSLSRLAQRYGPVMLLKFGAKPIVVISSAEAAKEVLKVHDLDCCSRPLSASAGKLTYNYQDIVFAPYGEYWREIRKVCVLELFSAARVQSYCSIREEEVALLVNSISQSSSSETPVNILEKMLPPTASILCRIAFGKSFRGSDLDNEKFQEVLHEAEAMLASFSASEFFPYVGWIVDRLSGRFQRLDKIFHELDNFLQLAIDFHLNPDKTKEEHEDLVDVLLRIEREQAKSGGAPFTRDNIKAILFDIFLGGSNTAAITTVWAMAELARNPRVMKKAQDEVRNLVGNKGKIAESDTPHLPYLKMIMKETLRLHPPAAMLLPRETMAPFKISGYDICPKSLLQVNNWAIARDPEYWKNPEEFNPERFDDSSIDYKGQNFEFLPFGSGRRGCPGMHMGTTTVELALANLLYCFDWKLPSGMKEEDINMEESTGPGLTKKRTPLKLVPVKFF
ncbi:cytochrome P450 71B9-like [Juglans microcarpa x Juglans regia]|uniref:cytochrome P450 71B9-like n=1 Tax=Juglans microcarpa x Juglans regia TaxID=2249226 RepID=UPI001B7E99F7|nr:cytochrome P450 71B9-like [Juglans microcarpa x Juglans regia]